MSKRSGLAGGSSLALACCCLLVASASAVAKPDLVVKGFQLNPAPGVSNGGPPHALIDSEGFYRVGVEYGIRNNGNSAARASRARYSDVTRLQNSFRIDDSNTDRLPAGSRQNASGVVKARSPTNDAIDLRRFQVCADAGNKVKESNENNNCSPKLSLRLMPETWSVTRWSVVSSTTGGPTRETETGVGSFSFRYRGWVGNTNEYDYEIAGRVQGSSSGMLGPCTVSGSGQTSMFDPWPRPDGYPAHFRIDSDLSKYLATLSPAYLNYTEMLDCPDAGTVSYDQPYQLMTTKRQGSFSIPVPNSGNRTLKKSYTEGSQTGASFTYAWTYEADIP